MAEPLSGAKRFEIEESQHEHVPSEIIELLDSLYTEPGPPASVQRRIREAGFAPLWAYGH